MRRANRKDGNQAEIMKQLKSVPNLSVFDTSRLGDGFPDLVVGYCGMSYLYEIKMPGCKLTPDEVKFSESWAGHWMIVYCVEDILLDLGLMD